MKQIHVGCVLTDQEYQRFKELCDLSNTYPSAAIREAVMEWMEAKKSADN